MAYTYADLYRLGTIGTARAIEEQQQMLILNKAQNLIWRSADWRWTIGNLNPFWLEPNIQDYGSPIVAVPDDFQRIQKCALLKLTDPSPITQEMKYVFELSQENTQGTPQQISFLRATRSFRVWPRPSGGMGAPYYLINSTYKKLPTRIITTTYQTTELPSQDHQIEMWLAALDWAYASQTKDPEAGAVQVLPDGRVVYTKKLATAMAAIKQESLNEGLNQGAPQIAPTEPLLGPGRPVGWLIW
jgi:hypothetical protein